MIESYSRENLLNCVNEASDPQPHVLFVAIPRRGMRHVYLHQSEHQARAMVMQFQCFDPDLVNFESIRPATPEEIAHSINGNLLLEEPL
jgi:hypothetical protein